MPANPKTKKRKRQRKRQAAGESLKSELKIHDTGLSGPFTIAPNSQAGCEADPGGGANCLNWLQEGTSKTTRIGRIISVKKIYVTGRVEFGAYSSATEPTQGAIQVYLVWDKQTNGAQLNSEDVFTLPVGLAEFCTTHVRNMDRSKRFKVLRKFEVFEDMGSLTSDTLDVFQLPYRWVPFEFIVDNLNIKVLYSGNAGTVADIVDNSFHILAFCSVAAPTKYIQYNCRIYFYDA